MFFRPRLERTEAGDYALRLTRAERAVLRGLPGELLLLLETDAEDPALRRLFPPAYEDTADEAEYRRLARDELLDGRREALRVLADTVDRDRLSAEEAQAWLTALNDLRLVLGTRLGVTEDDYEREPDPRDPRARDFALYGYLTWLQDQVVQALAAGL